MKLLRKTLLGIGLVFAAMTLAGAVLWVNNPNTLNADFWLRVGAVFRGDADLLDNRAPGELIRYSLRRLEGHDKLQALAQPALRWAQAKYERPVPPGPLPTLGKGQQATALPPVQYDPTGIPIELAPAYATSEVVVANPIQVNTVATLLKAIEVAQPGQTIVIAPGRYTLNTQINTLKAGTATQPITVRAAQPGQVTLNFDAQVAFRVSQPFWVFENLHIRGVCGDDGYCEHAFHVFGEAKSIVIRNNLVEDFNASIKINGFNQSWPDYGLIQYNTLTNTHRRETENPVTLIDLVGANQWRVSDNIISNFVKGQGNQVSYGAFMKGASSGGRIERNLVICTPSDISQPGIRVGISFGGGTTGAAYCRDQRCDVEHKAGMAANNIVAHCNDVGIDVNRSNGILVAHNTLVNTAGMDVRQSQASARFYGNLFEGRIRPVKGGLAKLDMNTVVDMTDVFKQPDTLQLEWRNQPENIPSLSLVGIDFYGHTRLDGTAPGAFSGADLPASK